MGFEIEQYARRDSWLNRWDARWKLSAVAVFVFCVAALDRRGAALAAAGAGAVMLAGAGLPVSLVWRRFWPLHLLLLPCFLIIPFTAPGPHVHFAGFALSAEGLRQAFLLYLRAIAIICASMALVYSTPINTLLRAAERMRLPNALTQVALLTYRYLFSLTWEWNNVRNALRTRGFQNQTSLRTYRTLANVIGITLIRSLERTDRIYNAMRCRGYRGTARGLETFETRAADAAAFAAVSLGSIGLVAWCHWI